MAPLDLTISAHGPALIVDYLRARGFDGHAIARSVGIDGALLDDVDARVHGALVLSLWSEAARRLGRSIGVDLATYAASAPPTLGASLLLHAPTLRGGISRLIRHERMFHDAPVASVHELGDGEVELRLESMVPGLPAPPLPVEFALAWVLAIGRRAAGDDELVPTEVRFAHPFRGSDEDRSRISEAFGVDVWFREDANAIRFLAVDLDRPHRDASDHTLALVERHVGAVAELRSRALQSTRADVAWRVARALPDLLTIDHVASDLGTSPRTLQRRLKDEGVSFRDVRDDVRHRIALGLLDDPENAILDVACATGFSDPRAFRRAFREWTGRSPSEHRRLQRSPRPKPDQP